MTIQPRTTRIHRAQRLGGIAAPPPRAGLAGFQNKLAAAIVEHDTAGPLLDAILEIMLKLPRVVGAGFVNLDADGLALANPSQYGGVVFGRGDYQTHLSQACRSTIETQCVTAVASPDVKNLTTVCSPIGVENPIRQVISIAVADGPNSLETELLIPQIVAAYVVLWQLSH
ncbi:hypothetical protein OAH18_01765, partial [bacterium]|nr:hypothetical protein [bacterium]